MKKIFITILLPCFLSVSYSQEIDKYLAAPFPTDLVSATDGKSIAWVFNDQGSRNIYWAQAPDYEAIQLTHYQGDDGIEINNLQFSIDGLSIYFIRGNAPNGTGEIANPAQLPMPVPRTLYRLTIASKEIIKITETAYYKQSPSGTHIVYTAAGQLNLLAVNQVDSKPEKLFHGRGNKLKSVWSPDGTKIAFTSGRADHTFIGIYDLNTKRYKYIESTMDHDSHFTWSPDGKKIAYIRVPHKHDRIIFIAQREYIPWSIRLYDLSTEKNIELWKADVGKGSVLFENLPTEENLLWWNAYDQLIFPWEKDGWQHLYSIDLKSKAINLLTPGKGEIENVKIANDLHALYYTCNIGDLERRHIWKYDFRRNTNVQLSKSDIEYNPVELSDNKVACLHATESRPAWPAIIRDNQIKEIATQFFPTEFPKSFVTPQLVNIKASDGKTCFGDLFLPSNYQKGVKYPAVIFLHGGSKRQMLLGFNYGSYYSNAYALNQYLANQGYIVLALNFRSGIGYGFDFREAPNYGAGGASEYYDLLGAGLYLQSRADVNRNKVGLWGGSYGGYLTAHGLARASHVFSCGVDIHGVHDWNTEIPTFSSWYNPLNYPEIAATAKISSPLHYIKGWKNPVLLIHGDDDRNVPIAESILLIEKLRKQNVPVENIILPDEIHGFLLHANWLKTYRATISFLDHHLKN